MATETDAARDRVLAARAELGAELEALEASVRAAETRERYAAGSFESQSAILSGRLRWCETRPLRTFACASWGPARERRSPVLERLTTAHLADDDAIRSHTQGVSHQVSGGHGALALDIRRSGLKPHHVFLLQFQFGGVLDGHNALVFRNVIR